MPCKNKRNYEIHQRHPWLMRGNGTWICKVHFSTVENWGNGIQNFCLIKKKLNRKRSSASNGAAKTQTYAICQRRQICGNYFHFCSKPIFVCERQAFYCCRKSEWKLLNVYLCGIGWTSNKFMTRFSRRSCTSNPQNQSLRLKICRDSDFWNFWTWWGFFREALKFTLKSFRAFASMNKVHDWNCESQHFVCDRHCSES